VAIPNTPIVFNTFLLFIILSFVLIYKTIFDKSK